MQECLMYKQICKNWEMSPRRISDLYPKAMPLHYTLLFINGMYKWDQFLTHKGNQCKRVSQREFYAYHMNIWCTGSDYLFLGHRLYKEWILTSWISLFKFGSCLFVCPFVTFFFNWPWIHQMKSKLHQTSSICQLWSPELIYNIRGHAHARVHTRQVKMCTLLLCLFLLLFCQFFKLLNPFLTENEKNRGHTPDMYRWGATFSFYSFCFISVRKSSKIA